MTPLDSRIDEDFVGRFYRGEPFVFEGQLEDADGAVESLDGRTFWGCIMAADGEILHEVIAEILGDRTGKFYRGVFDGAVIDACFGMSGLIWSQGEHVATLGRRIHAQGPLIIYPGPGSQAPDGVSGIAAIAQRIVRRDTTSGRSMIRISQGGARGPTPWEAEAKSRDAWHEEYITAPIAAQVDALGDIGAAVEATGLNREASLVAQHGAELARDQAGERAALAGQLAMLLQRVPSEDLLAAITDRELRRTWLEARASDGGPSLYALAMLLTRMDETTGLIDKLAASAFVEAPGLLAVLTDRRGFYTDLAVDAATGQLADFVVARLAPRIAAHLDIAAGRSGGLPSDRHMRGGTLLPLLTDMTTIVGWGSSTIAGLAPYLTALAAGLGAAAGPAAPAYVDGGKGGEWSTHTAARLGSVPALLTVTDGSIPASGGATVTASNMAASANMKPFAGTLAGVPGTLSSTASVLTFTRTTAGSTVAVAAGTPFIPTLGTLHRNAVTIMNMGKNDATAGIPAAEILPRIDASWDYLSAYAPRGLMLGQFVDTNTSSGSTTRSILAAINAANAARYGDRFIDVGAYLTGAQVWADTGITPTSEDLAAQALGNKPPSISEDSGHLNEVGKGAVTNFLIRPKLVTPGWWS